MRRLPLHGALRRRGMIVSGTGCAAMPVVMIVIVSAMHGAPQ